MASINIPHDRKPIFWITIAAIVLIAFAGIFILANLVLSRLNLKQSIYEDAGQNTLVKLSVQNSIITPATQNYRFILANQSDVEYIYGVFTVLEKQINQNWYTVPTRKGANWIMLAYILEPHSQVQLDFSIFDFYDKLKPGKYRWVKEISEYASPKNESYVICEFTVGSEIISTSSFSQGDIVTDTMQFSSESILEIKMTQMKDGQKTIVDNKDQINRIMMRLSQLHVEKDLGTRGIYLDGYALEFSLAEGSDTRKVIIQFDSESDGLVYGILTDRHYYELSDHGSEQLNSYFEQRKYSVSG
jgi:hypothetical protein